MTRTLVAVLLAVFGLSSDATAQVYYGPAGSTGYYHTPDTNYGYSTGYGPLSVFDWRWWSGRPPYTGTYAAPSYGSSYTAGFSPAYTASYAPAYTVGYSPVVTTAGYAGSFTDTALAYYSPPLANAGTPCCEPCLACASCCPSCPGGNCASGNCGLNYGPVDMSPSPDPSSSGSSGTKTFRSESDGTSGGVRTNEDDRANEREAPPDDGFGPYERDRADPAARESGYGPESPIRQKAPIEAPGDSGPKSADPAAEDGFEAPGDAEKADGTYPAALNLDATITRIPSFTRERVRMTARFSSPQLARAIVDPAGLPAAENVRLVRK